jgi:hypothetical protein
MQHALRGQLAPQQRLRYGPSATRARASRSRALVAPVLAELSAKGRSYNAGDISLKRIIGEGSFGQCFEASSIFSLPLRGRAGRAGAR